MVYKVFDKTSSSGAIRSITILKQRPTDLACVVNVCDCKLQLAKELHELVIINFEKLKVCSSFKDNIWGADLADMQLISKYNKGFRFLVGVIDFKCY